MSYTNTGIKNIGIVATTQYPIVSAYEFEFLKAENVVRERMSNCTIYFILQRPLTYFNNLTADGRCLTFDIVDGQNPALRCHFDLVDSDIVDPDEDYNLDVQFYKKVPDEAQPFNEVGAFKILRGDLSFVLWETPQKFLYEVLVNGLPAKIDGDPTPFLDYKVHYIGKAFSQKVWDRLAGHDKMQKILTLEGPLADGNSRAPFEISVLMLDIIGHAEANLVFPYDFAVPSGVLPITYPLDTDDQLVEFFTKPLLDARAQQLTNEVEAMLINRFKPEYNDVLFDNYPAIRSGTRSAGYTCATLDIRKLPVRLWTSHSDQSPIGINLFDLTNDHTCPTT